MKNASRVRLPIDAADRVERTRDVSPVLPQILGTGTFPTLAAAQSPSAFVQSSTNDEAVACFVHLHGDEPTARDVLGELLKEGNTPANAVWLSRMKAVPDSRPSQVRRVKITSCSIDPNRVFTRTGLELQKTGCGDGAAVDAWVEQLRDAVKQCSKGYTLPVIAFHNNAAFKKDEFKQNEAIAIDFKVNEGNFILVTEPSDYRKINEMSVNKKLKTILLKSGEEDTGALSVLLEKKRYVNLEFRTNQKAVGRQMADVVLEALGLSSTYE